LLKHDFEHEVVHVLLLRPNVVRVLDLVGFDFVDGVERNRRDRPREVANRVVLVLVVPERARRDLEPAVDKVLLNARLELNELSFPNHFLLWVYDYFVDVSLKWKLRRLFLLLNKDSLLCYLSFLRDFLRLERLPGVCARDLKAGRKGRSLPGAEIIEFEAGLSLLGLYVLDIVHYSSASAACLGLFLPEIESLLFD